MRKRQPRYSNRLGINTSSLSVILIGFVLTIYAVTASAAPMTIRLSGPMFDNPALQLAPPYPPNPLDVGRGDSWSMTYTFESSTPDSDATDTRGEYHNVLMALTFTLGDFTFDLDPLMSSEMIILNDYGPGSPGSPGADKYTLRAAGSLEDDHGFTSVAVLIDSLNFNSVLPPFNQFDSDALPLKPPPLTGDLNQFIVDFETTSSETVRYQGIWSQAAVVPEPSTLALLGIGLVGLGWMGRKKKRS